MITLKELSLETLEKNAFYKITDQVRETIADSGIQIGMVFIVTAHCTSGIMSNENLSCLEEDLMFLLDRAAPERDDYLHARYLQSYGACGGNTTGHAKGLFTGNHNVFPVKDGKLLLGAAQDIYFCEFDGPQLRKYYVEVMGE